MQAMEMRCYRRLHNISCIEHITNEVRNRIKHAIGPYEDLLTTVKRRMLNVSRSSGFSKTSIISETLLMEMVEGSSCYT